MHASLTRNASQVSSAVVRSAVFFLKVLPTMPSRPVDWVTPRPVLEHVTFSAPYGGGVGDLYRPSGLGPHPGIVVCLGVVPFGFDHPQVPRLGEALARSGFATLLYRSPTMEQYRLEPEDVGNVAAAYDYLVRQPFVRAEHSGLFGTCVGGAFALLAAAHPAVRDRVAFVGAFAPYASMRTLVLQIAAAVSLDGHEPRPWEVDPLTRKVFLHSITSMLEADEATRLRTAFGEEPGGLDVVELSPEARSVHALLVASDLERARIALGELPPALLVRMDAISPVVHAQDIHAPLVIIGHDRDDVVIPVGESQALRRALADRRGLRYTEFGMFQHADPTKRKLRPLPLARELGKFYRYVYPMFREAARA